MRHPCIKAKITPCPSVGPAGCRTIGKGRALCAAYGGSGMGVKDSATAVTNNASALVTVGRTDEGAVPQIPLAPWPWPGPGSHPSTRAVPWRQHARLEVEGSMVRTPGWSNGEARPGPVRWPRGRGFCAGHEAPWGRGVGLARPIPTNPSFRRGLGARVATKPVLHRPVMQPADSPVQSVSHDVRAAEGAIPMQCVGNQGCHACTVCT